MKKFAFFAFVGVLMIGCTTPTELPLPPSVPTTTTTMTGVVQPLTPPSGNITHRLADGDALVGYLSEDVLDLRPFEEWKVTLDGVWKTESMRQVFVPHTVELLDANAQKRIKAPATQLLHADAWSFQVPNTWGYWGVGADGLYFHEQADEDRKAFLTFRVMPLSDAEALGTPNAEHAGAPSVDRTEVSNGLFQRVVTLMPEGVGGAYQFQLTTKQTAQELQMEFGVLLSNLTLTEDATAMAMQDYYTEQARSVAAAVRAEEALRRVGQSEPPAQEQNDTENAQTPAAEKESVALPEYKNLINARANEYAGREGYTVKIPSGYWYRSFGPEPQNGNSINRLGISKDSSPESFEQSDIQVSYNRTMTGGDTQTEEDSACGVRDEFFGTETQKTAARYFGQSECTYVAVTGAAEEQDMILSILEAFEPSDT